MTLLKRLEGGVGRERVLAMMDAFFASRDPFIRTAGHTVGVFSSQFNKLLQQATAEPDSLVVRAFDRLDAMDAARFAEGARR